MGGCGICVRPEEPFKTTRAPTEIVRSGFRSDQGKQVESKLFSDMCNYCIYRRPETTQYHPNSDAVAERFLRKSRTLCLVFLLTKKTFSNWDGQSQFVLITYQLNKALNKGLTQNIGMLGQENNLPLRHKV